MDPYDAVAYSATLDEQLPAFTDLHRQMNGGALDGIDEDEARLRLVPSATTLLGLVKHATFVERVWFGEAVTGRSRADLGLVAGPEASFELAPEDTIDTVTAGHRRAVEQSRAVEGLDLDAVLPGNRRGPLPLRWVYLHVLRELAQHCGHADILREQILGHRGPGST